MCCNEGHGHHHGHHHGGQGDEGGHGDCGCGRHGEQGHERGYDCCEERHGEHDCGCGDRHGHDGCGEQEHRHGRGHGCCCEGEPGRHFQRRFHTREERLASLEGYLQDLQAEVKAVEEQIAELKAAQ